MFCCELEFSNDCGGGPLERDSADAFIGVVAASEFGTCGNGLLGRDVAAAFIGVNAAAFIGVNADAIIGNGGNGLFERDGAAAADAENVGADDIPVRGLRFVPLFQLEKASANRLLVVGC